jgi:hypothetical protein
LHALLVMATEAGAQLCDELGETGAAQDARALAAKLRGHVPPFAASSKQAAALLALAALHPPQTINSKVLSQNPLRGLSTFYGYYVLQARALAGDHAGALDVIRHYWGTMLDLGATTFWEHFELDWAQNAGRIDELTPEGRVDVHASYGEHCYIGHRHSLCHGWAAGPTAWLTEHVLGIRPLTAGCTEVLVEPHLED